MTIKSKQLFIIIGDDKTGKTTLQKLLIKRLCGFGYDRLPVNKQFDISHPEIKRKYQSIFFSNRSYQEKISEYKTVDNYFQKFFQSADIAFVSSHLVLQDIQKMIVNGRNMFYNINGIFWTNSIENNRATNAEISSLDWNERFVIINQYSDDDDVIQRQIDQIADSIVALLINRTSVS